MAWRRILQRKPWILQSCCAYRAKHALLPTTTALSAQRDPILGFLNPIGLAASDSFNMRFELNSSCAMMKCGFSSHAWVDPPLSRIIEIPLAQTGEGIAECELLKWFIKEGDQVEEFQPLCEVQSDKATIEITSRYKGKVSQILYEPGDIVKVGETLLMMTSEESQASTSVSNGPDNTDSVLPDKRESSIDNCSLDKPSVREVQSTPAVRHLAKQYGININDIHGSGQDGRVLKEDILRHAAYKGMGIEESVPPLEEDMLTKVCKSSDTLVADRLHFEDKKILLRGFQRAMVKSMTMAAKVPHFHYLEEINFDALVDLKSSFNHENSDPNIKHTYLPFLIKSLSTALVKYPLLNSDFSEELLEVTLKGSHNIGIAMATPYGLVVPNIKKVQSLSILEITKELSRLQQLALNNKLSPEDISGGTITLSNIGAIGGKFGSPLLNLPEVAIIAIGRIEKVPRFADDGSVYPASIANVNIGADHRVVDGATVARFCNEWKLLIEKPEMLMLHMR